MSMPLSDLVVDNLILRVHEPGDSSQADRISLQWCGKANLRQPVEVLTPYFQKVVAVAEEGGKFIEFHFKQLEHLNSSTILALMKLIQILKEKRIRLRVYYDAGLKWQKMTFEALRQLDRDDGLFELCREP